MEEKKEKLKQPPIEIKVKIGPKGHENEYTIKFPNNGQLIDIERRKQTITGGLGREILSSNSVTSYQAFLLSEAIATFSILTPIEKDMTINVMELNPLQSKSFRKAYEKYYEWIKSWMAFTGQEDEEDQEDKEE